MVKVAKLLPEMLSVIVFLIILFQLMKQKNLYLSAKYVVVFFVVLLIIICGLILNNVPFLPIISGLRTYFKYLPFFFLPAVFLLNEKDMVNQMKLILAFAIIQVPYAIYQRLFATIKIDGVIYSPGEALTGDHVRGTLSHSGNLTIFLICMCTMLVAFYLKKKITFPYFIVLISLLLIPTMINETKVTLFLIPIALIVPTVLFNSDRGNVKRITGMLLVGLVFIAVFIPVYDHFMKPRWGYGIVDFFSMEGRVVKYLSRGEDKISQGREGRLDAVRLSYQALSNDPAKLLFGLGIGNVSESTLGEDFTGDYFHEYGEIKGATFSNLLWEVGWIGAILMVFICLFIFKDARRNRYSDSINGAIALGWCGVMSIIIVTLMYKNTIHSNVLGYLFWYFSGFVASMSFRARLRQDKSI